MTSVEEVVVVIILSEEFCSLSHGSVSDCIFHVVSDRLIEVLVSRDETELHTDVLTSVRTHFRIFQCPVGQLLVESVKAFYHDVRQCDYSRVADHAVSLVAPEMPYRKFSLLLIDIDHGIRDVIDLFRMDDGHERHCGTVGVPQRESRVVHEVAGLVNLVIGASVVAVHVIEDRRLDHRVVHRGVEHSACLSVVSINLDFREFLVPGLLGSLYCSFEIPLRHLGLHVGLSAVHAYRRKGNLDHNLLTLSSMEVNAAVRSHVLELVEWLAELGIEERLLVLCPAGRVSVAADCHAIDSFCQCLCGFVPASAVFEVENDCR